MQVCGLVALLVAAARPQRGVEEVVLNRTSVSFIVALDLSASMLAEDMKGTSRLRVAKKAILELLPSVSGADQVGVIAFAGDAFLAVPITQDHAAVRRRVDALEPGAIRQPGSDLAEAVKLAEKAFTNSSSASKALVLISDGEELQGDAILAASAAARQGLRIFTVGVGTTAGARIPDRSQEKAEGFVRDELGKEVTSKLNERMLQQLAANGLGGYQPLGSEGEGLRATYLKGVRPLARQVRTQSSTEVREWFQWPLGVAILLLLGEVLVNERRKGGPVNL